MCLKHFLERFDISNEINCNNDSVRKVIERKIGYESTTPDEETTIMKNKYREEEYKALVGNLELDKIISRDFKIERVEGSKYNLDHINKVILVYKMREVRALTAFSRINPPDQNVIFDGHHAMGNIVSSKEEKTNWYPAFEVRGEGIFIEFNNRKIDEWVEKYEDVGYRAELINDRQREILEQRGFSKRIITYSRAIEKAEKGKG